MYTYDVGLKYCYDAVKGVVQVLFGGVYREILMNEETISETKEKLKRNDNSDFDKQDYEETIKILEQRNLDLKRMIKEAKFGDGSIEKLIQSLDGENYDGLSLEYFI